MTVVNCFEVSHLLQKNLCVAYRFAFVAIDRVGSKESLSTSSHSGDLAPM